MPNAFATRSVAASLLLVLALVTGEQHRPASMAVRSVNPLAGMRFWLDSNRSPNIETARLAKAGDTADAALLRKIAVQPAAVWLASPIDIMRRQIRDVLTAAATTASVPIFVAYNLPGRDCGRYSVGGASAGAGYRAWVDAAASAIGSATAVVIVEPDAVAEVVAGCLRSRAAETEASLRYAVTAFGRSSRTRVYLDAGNSAWVSDPRLLVRVLRAAGIGSADGFALNVSNFQTTPDSVHYGHALSAALGGAHFVVDTSRNGLGPLPEGSAYPGPAWCNPPGRALGYRPTTNTAQPLVDAYLWIKLPGSSDGNCGIGDPPPGTFWPAYAFGLAARAAY